MANGSPVSYQAPAEIAISTDDVHFTFADSGTGNVYICSNPANGAVTCTSYGSFTDPRSTVADSNYVYIDNTGAGSVLSCPILPGTCTTLQTNPLASGAPTDDGMALDTSSVYYAVYINASLGNICEVLKTGSGQLCSTAIATSQGGPVRVAVDSANIYWSDDGDGQICTAPKTQINGGCTTVIASNQSSPYGIAIDSSYIYWINSGNGQVCWALKNVNQGSCNIIATDPPAGSIAIAVDP
ncbi:MAG: hypothetical protein ACRETA_00435 [Gammaproteobacteria bacterium]